MLIGRRSLMIIGFAWIFKSCRKKNMLEQLVQNSADRPIGLGCGNRVAMCPPGLGNRCEKGKRAALRLRRGGGFRHISPLHCLRMQMHDLVFFFKGVTWGFVVLCWKIGVTCRPLGVVWHRGGVRALISVADVVRWGEIRMPVSNFPITEWGDWWWMAWHAKWL